MDEDRLSILYELSERMSAAGKDVKEKHTKDYETIIEYLKTSENSKERSMAAQLISRFFKYFPDHEHDAFDSIVDLCESADVAVRKHATMAMIAICQDCKQVVSKAADILIQLYQTNQPSEVNLINLSLNTLLNLDIEKFLKSFFANFEDGGELVRERAIKFLSSKIHTVSETSLTKEVEEQLMNYVKKSMEDVTKDEFIAFIGILNKLKIAKTSSGQATIVSAIKSQAEMDKEFDVNDHATLEKFLLCTRHTIPFLSQYNRASEYINYICLKILPNLPALTPTGMDLKVLQALAEMSPYIIIEDAPGLINLEECHKAVYDKLLEYLPKPPEVIDVQPITQEAPKTEGDVKPTTEVAGTTDGAEATNGQQVADAEATKPSETKKSQEADFQFTHIEYLLYTFIQLCRLKPELYTESMQVEGRKQLSHLSNGCKKYTNALERQLSSIVRQDLDFRSVALRTTKNISTMIVGLFKRPCDFKTNIVLSCKPLKVEPVSNPNPRPVSTHQHQHQHQQRPSYHQNRSKRFNNDHNNMRFKKKPRTHAH